MRLNTALKNNTLRDLATLIASHESEIIAANALDLENTVELDPTLVDRLKVSPQKVAGMVAAVEEVLAKEDPIGKVLYTYTHPNGVKVENRVVPFGRILIIYESRPDVTIEAAISAFKAGNRILLKGGKEARHTNLALVDLWHQALAKNGLTNEYVTYLNIDRTETQRLLRDNSHRVDLIIPRGGEGLINYIKANTQVPLLVSGRGNNFLYIHDDADFEMAVSLVLDGKSRLSVCNATDKVLINRNLPGYSEKLPVLIAALQEIGMEIFGDDSLREIASGLNPLPGPEIWEEEFLAPKILLGAVDTLEAAIEKINLHSGGHTAVIVCKDERVAANFQQEVDCAAVNHNASSRFTDGGQFGFGAEIAISTQKLHFRGPLAHGQLVTNKWFVKGEGQVRG